MDGGLAPGGTPPGVVDGALTVEGDFVEGVVPEGDSWVLGAVAEEGVGFDCVELGFGCAELGFEEGVVEVFLEALLGRRLEPPPALPVEFFAELECLEESGFLSLLLCFFFSALLERAPDAFLSLSEPMVEQGEGRSTKRRRKGNHYKNSQCETIPFNETRKKEKTRLCPCVAVCVSVGSVVDEVNRQPNRSILRGRKKKGGGKQAKKKKRHTHKNRNTNTKMKKKNGEKRIESSKPILLLLLLLLVL